MIDAKPLVFDYQNFRAYLHDVFEYRKANEDGFSLRTLAKQMGLSTHAHFFDVIYGRTLTEKFIDPYVRWLGLDQKGEEYFKALIKYDQAKRDSEKQQAFKSMVRLSPQLEMLRLGARYVQFFENWYQPVLLTLLTLHPKEQDPEMLARLFKPRLKPVQVSDALKVFAAFDLAKWDTEKGEWVLSSRFLRCEDTFKKMALRPYHLKMMELGMLHYDQHYEQQQFASMTLATTQATMQKVQEIIKDTRQRIMDVVRQDREQEMLVQVNLQTFEIVRKP